METPQSPSHREFTIMELILVFGVIAILASVAVLWINPNTQLANARNEQRKQDMNAILAAFYQYALQHDGKFPMQLPSKDQEICRGQANWPAGVSNDCKGLFSLESLTGSFLVTIPMDPLLSTSAYAKYRGTWYRIRKDVVTNRIVLTASGSLSDDVLSGVVPKEISVSR